MAVERRILVVDVGGNNVKCWTPTLDERRKTPSGPKLTAEAMAAAVLALTSDWDYDVVSLGVPGPVAANTVAREPVNLGTGWVGFDFTAAFGRPTRVVNDAVDAGPGLLRGRPDALPGSGHRPRQHADQRRPRGRHGAGPPALPQWQDASSSMWASAGCCAWASGAGAR